MNRRLEWFISSVFDHYFGETANGKYDGLFYGWDVVNEAVIGNSYRTDTVSAAESLDEIQMCIRDRSGRDTGRLIRSMPGESASV